MTDLILYQTIHDAEGEEAGAWRWDCANLHDAVHDLSATRTTRCDGVQYRLARYTAHSATLLLTVQNGIEYRTGCNEERVLAVCGINRGTARRLARQLGCEWQA